ncbi:uncharacterized protein VTP21DRAFT_2464 [Calcarisporiella thermophila]|uniref:uncharacterized protein n=1 Tax=Calcarisporiella thermophila TaxID=911321 RepID=UPI003743C63B
MEHVSNFCRRHMAGGGIGLYSSQVTPAASIPASLPTYSAWWMVACRCRSRNPCYCFSAWIWTKLLSLIEYGGRSVKHDRKYLGSYIVDSAPIPVLYTRLVS